MKNHIVLAVVLFVSACSSTGIVPNNDQEIKKFADRRDTEKLVDIAKNADKRERIMAMEALGNLRDPRAVPALTQALQTDSWVVRETAVKAMGNIKDYLCVKPLIDALNDNDKFVREAAIKGLRRTVASMAKTKDLRFYKPLLGALAIGDNITRDSAYDALLLGVSTLKRFQDTNLFKPLFSALEQDNLYVREAAARLLGDIKDAAVVSPLIEAQEDNSKFVRDAAVESLQQVNDSRAVPALLEALASGSEDIRKEAIKVLSKFSDLDSVNQITEALKDKNPQIRTGAAKALGNIGNAYAVKPLIPLLNDPDSEARLAAAEALKKLSWFPDTEDEKASNCVAGQQWDECVTLGKIVTPHLVVALGDKSDTVRSKAADALSRLQWQPSSDDEKAKYCSAQHDWSKCIELGTAAISNLAMGLKNADTAQRIEIADALGNIGSPLCIEPLTDALQDNSQDVRVAAVHALAKIKDSATVSALVKALDNSNRFVRLEAAQVLEEHIGTYSNSDNDNLVRVLLTALEDNNRSVRQMGARLLGKIKDPRATIPLIKTLEDPEYEVREEASMALRNIKDPQAIEPLVKALNSKNPEVREHVIKTLGEFKDNRAIEPLMATIQDPDPEVRAAAIQVFGTIKDPRAMPPIMKALHDENENVRLQAVKVLGQSYDPEAILALKEKLADIAAPVRQAAGEALLDLKWNPNSADDQGWHCLISRDWARCIELGKPALLPLISELNQQDSPIKVAIARTLGEIKETGAIEPLIKYMESARAVLNNDQRQEIYDTVTTSLIDIGKPSASHMVAKLTDWPLAQYAAKVLQALQWTPRSDEELVHFKVAVRDKQFIADNWELVRRVLTRDLNSKDFQDVENALFAFIGIGRKEVVEDLVAVLSDKGNLPLAEAYLNSGQNRLADAAELWAMNNGFKVHQFKKGVQPVQWGSL